MVIFKQIYFLLFIFCCQSQIQGAAENQTLPEQLSIQTHIPQPLTGTKKRPHSPSHSPYFSCLNDKSGEKSSSSEKSGEESSTEDSCSDGDRLNVLELMVQRQDKALDSVIRARDEILQMGLRVLHKEEFLKILQLSEEDFDQDPVLKKLSEDPDDSNLIFTSILRMVNIYSQANNRENIEPLQTQIKTLENELKELKTTLAQERKTTETFRIKVVSLETEFNEQKTKHGDFLKNKKYLFLTYLLIIGSYFSVFHGIFLLSSWLGFNDFIVNQFY
jgi:hypothetical protein